MNTVDVQQIATRVAACPGVVRLSAGSSGTVETYLPGDRVVGIRVVRDNVEIHVVGRWEVASPVLADAIRAKVASLVDGRRVDVVIDEISDPPDAA